MKLAAPHLAAYLLCLLVAATSCSSKKEGAAAGPGGPPPNAVKDYPVLTLAPGETELHTDYPATLQGQVNVEIRPKIDGYIDQLLVDEGARVKKGQLLVRLNSDEADQSVRSAQAAVLVAEANANSARKDVQKTQPLVDRKILSQYQLDAYQYTLQAQQGALAQARAQLLSARKTQSYTRITSPVNGVIGTLPYRQGALVNATSAEPLTTVSSIERVRAYFSINEKDALASSEANKGVSLKKRLAKLPSVRLVLASGTEYTESGRIETASGLVSTETGSVTVRASFPNPDGALRSGATGLVRVPQHLTNVLLVPQAATYELQGKRFVYVVGPGGKVKNTEIQVLSLTDGQNYVVEKGLKAGDQLVTEGVSGLQDGQTIKPRTATAGATTAPAPAGATAPTASAR